MVSIIRTPDVKQQARRIGAQAVAATSGAAMELERTDLTEPVASPPAITQEEFEAQVETVRQQQRRAEAAEQRLAEMEAALDELQKQSAEEGYQAGYEHGSKAGEEAAQQDFAEQIRRLRGIGEALQQDFSNRMVTALQDGIVEVVFAAVTKILGEELARAAGVQALVQCIASEIAAREQYTVRLAPADLELINQPRRMAPGSEASAGITYVADERVRIGGCIIETAAGSIDARLETQLQRLKEVLLDVRAQRLGEEAG